jgi:hypothetical protein
MKVKALRVAAGLLVAHYLILLGLAFLAQGAPRWLHLMVAGALVIVAAGALLSPRRLGWLPVVAYAVVILGQHAITSWGVVTSAAHPFATKAMVLGMLAALDSLVLAALVLVFLPAK